MLTAFQGVEDEIAAARVLEQEAVVRVAADQAAIRAEQLALNQYQAGQVDYTTVVTAQNTALASQETSLNVLQQRLTASVTLIENLGGGWDSTQLPASSGRRWLARPSRRPVGCAAGRHALVALALADLGVVGPQFEDIEVAERGAQHRLVVEVFRDARAAGGVSDVFGAVAFDQDQATQGFTVRFMPAKTCSRTGGGANWKKFPPPHRRRPRARATPTRRPAPAAGRRPMASASRFAFICAGTDRSLDTTSRPCSASRATPLRPSPSAMASALQPAFRREAWAARKALGATPKNALVLAGEPLVPAGRTLNLAHLEIPLGVALARRIFWEHN